MAKYVKTGVSIVVALGVAYGIGSYYANSMADREASKVTKMIKERSPSIQEVHYSSVSAGFFSLFTHSVQVNDVKVTFADMPEHPVHIKRLGLDHVNVNNNSVPTYFEVSIDDATIHNSDKLVEQAFDTRNQSSRKAYGHLSKNNVTVSEKRQQAINQYIASIARQYAGGKLDAHVTYSAKNAELSMHSDVKVDGDSVYQVDTSLSHYIIAKGPHGFTKAFTNARIKKLDYRLDLHEVGDKHILTRAFPQYQRMIANLDPELKLHLGYSAKSQDLAFTFDLTNNKALKLKLDSSLHDVRLDQYPLPRLQKKQHLHKAFQSAYIGRLNTETRLEADISQRMIAQLSPRYRRVFKQVFGDQKLPAYIDVTNHYDYDSGGQGKETMALGIEKLGHVNLLSEYVYKNKLTLEQLASHMQGAARTGSVVPEVRHQPGKNQKAWHSPMPGNAQIRKLSLSMTNNGLMEDLTRFYAGVTNTRASQVTQALQGQLKQAASSASGFHKQLFTSLSQYVANPESYQVTFTPKKKLTWEDLFEQYRQARRHINKEVAAKAPKNLSPRQKQALDAEERTMALQQTFNNSLPKFNYTFSVNGKTVE